MAVRIISGGYRKVARECYPDLGGNQREMVNLNLVKEKLDIYFK